VAAGGPDRALKALQDDGKIRHIGLSEVNVAQLEAASKIAPIVTVQNLYNLTNRSSGELLDYAPAPASASSLGSARNRLRSPDNTVRSRDWPTVSARRPRNSRSPGC